MYDIIMLNKDSFIKLMHMAASVRETRAICKSFSLKTRVNSKLATAIRYLIYKYSTFLRHKVPHSKLCDGHIHT